MRIRHSYRRAYECSPRSAARKEVGASTECDKIIQVCLLIVLRIQRNHKTYLCASGVDLDSTTSVIVIIVIIIVVSLSKRTFRVATSWLAPCGWRAAVDKTRNWETSVSRCPNEIVNCEITVIERTRTSRGKLGLITTAKEIEDVSSAFRVSV